MTKEENSDWGTVIFVSSSGNGRTIYVQYLGIEASERMGKNLPVENLHERNQNWNWVKIKK